MRFKDFLLEKAMNGKTFADVKKRLGTTAKVGFEFEMIIPEGSDLYSTDVQDNRSTQVISYFDTLEEFEEYFDMTRSDRRAIMSDFEDWQTEAENDFIEDNYDRYESEDVSEKEAREEARKNFDDRDYQFNDWLRKEFKMNIDFVDQYSLSPKYGWYEDSGRYASIYTEELEEPDGDHGGTAAEMKSSLEYVLKQKVEVFSNYHQTKKSSTTWYVEPDASIQTSNNKDHGLELVSPPLLMDEGIKAIDTIFKWMDGVGARTNDTTGLHINISVPNIEQKLDPVKLVLFMGEKFSTDAFGRTNNTHTKSQINMIMANVKSTGRLPSTSKDMAIVAKDFLSDAKHFTVNFRNLPAGYLEFRVAGGTGYEQNADKIKQMVYRLITAVEIACSPELERNEYLKKLTLLFDKAKTSVENSPVDPSVSVPKELMRLSKYDKFIASDYKNYVESTTQEEKRRAAGILMIGAVQAVTNFKTSLDLSEKIFLKKIAKEVALQSKDVDEFYWNNNIGRLRFKKEFAI